MRVTQGREEKAQNQGKCDFGHRLTLIFVQMEIGEIFEQNR